MTVVTKTAVVIGSGDIGRAVIDYLVDSGYDVTMTHFRHKIYPASHCLNVVNAEAVQEFVDLVLGFHEGIDVWVNCAGIISRRDWSKISGIDFIHTLAVNTVGTFLCCQAAMKVMKKQESGCIVNIASSGGQMGGTLAVDYAASKAGVISLTKSFANIGSPNVRVNCVSPGLIDSSMSKEEIESENGRLKMFHLIALWRPGTVDEVAQAVMLCVNNGYITGATIDVNGGLLMR